jgi:hypothetical protein
MKRTICAAPKNRVSLGKGMPRIVQCCTRSPIFGENFQKPSKYCDEHSSSEAAKTNVDGKACVRKKPRLDTESSSKPPIIVTINLKEYSVKNSLIEQSTQDLPDNDDMTVMQGCKKAENLQRFYDRTAGILAMVKPCGVIVNWAEMFTCESPSQVFTFLLRTRTIQGGGAIKYIGYDRACELVPFLRRLKRNGNVGAELLLSTTMFLVDLFHVAGHTTPACELGNEKFEFHPKLPVFSAIHGVNTQCAEQTFKWLDCFKFNVRKMTENKYKFFLYVLVQSRNQLIIKKQQRGK